MKNFNKLEKFESNETDNAENEEAKIIKFELDREWNESEKRAIKIVEKISENGSEVYFAGGVVRDYILNREPNDIDISTSASLEELEEIFGDDCFYVSPKAEEHGVLSVVVDDEIFEVAVFRKEIFQDNKDEIKKDLEDDMDDESKENFDKKAKKKKQKQISGRQADKVELENISAEEDAQRRDLTMNGMFYDPLKEEIIDYVGGCEDIENEIVRFVGDPKERIEEDKIRIIRFFRFKGVLGFDAEKESLDTIKDWLSDEDNRKKFKELFCLDQRIKHEFEKIIKSDSRVEILENLMKCGALELMFPQIVKMKGVEQPKEFHEEGDVWEHTKKCLENLPKDASLELIWAVLLHDTGKPETQETPEEDDTDRIRFNLHEKESVEIVTRILSIEKEPKEYKGQGLNEQGKPVKGLLYDGDFVSEVKWLIKNHMLYSRFYEMKEARQKRLMENENFPELLKLWKTDILGSLPVKMGEYEKAVEIWEKFCKRKDEMEDEKEEQIISSEEIMEALRSSGARISAKGILSLGEFRVGQIIKIFSEYFDNLAFNKKLQTKEDALSIIKKQILEKKILEEVLDAINNDEDIIKNIKELSLVLEGHEKKKRRLNKAINKKANEAFSSFLEERLGLR